MLALAQPVCAGPPFVTDDPEPTDQGHWEIYNFVTSTQTMAATSGQAGFDINYGGARDLQLTATLPLDFQSHARTAQGDIELAAKYRFVHQAEGSPWPDVAVFPRLIVPTGAKGYGPERLNVFLPIWAQKDFGPWSLFGGGGYQLNPGPENRNYWLSGLTLARSINDRLSVGVEIYHQTADARGDLAFTGVNGGVTYRLTEHWSLLGSAGPGVQNARAEDRYQAYVSIEATY